MVFPKLKRHLNTKNTLSTVILQIFGVVLFSIFSVVNGFSEIKKTPKYEKHIE